MRVTAAVRVSALAMGMASLAIGCGDVVPTAPAPATPSADLATTSVDTVAVIRRLTPIARDVTVGAWITKSGGTLYLPEAGLRVNVPAGAVQKQTYITATAHAGYLVSYEFGPHGTTFKVPLQLQQEAKNLNIWKDGALKPEVIPIQAGYFPARSDINQESGTATVHEILPVDVDLLGSKVHINVQHFSGYLLASGRK